MDNSTQYTTHQLLVEGKLDTVTLTKTAPTTAHITWSLPTTQIAYDGAIVLLSESKFSPEEFPVDGTRYTASADWNAPASVIGASKVVFAAYGFFNDDITVNSVDVFNLDPAKLYYASVHIASNVLQYNTQGTQSYLLDSSNFDKDTQTYSGAIHRATTAPSNPTNGQVYFDTAENVVYMWNATLSSWIKTTSNYVPVGDKPYIDINGIFLNTSTKQLYFFNNVEWVQCTNTNTRVKLGATWIALGNVTVANALPETPNVGDVAQINTSAIVGAPGRSIVYVYTVGGWFELTPDLMQISNDGTTWSPIVIVYPLTNTSLPGIPVIGDFFYDSNKKNLLVWTDTGWVRADNDSIGTPTTDRIGVGTDGSTDERINLTNILKRQLGYPEVCVELSEEQFNIAINNALQTFRQRADNAYASKFLSITLAKGQSVYYLNDPRNKTDTVVSVIKAYRVNMLGLSNLSAETGLYAQAFFNRLFTGQLIDLTSIHLFYQLSDEFERIFAGNLVFTWDEPSRQLTILRRIMSNEERIVLEVVTERTEQELLTDRYCQQWLQAWAESELWMTLGQIRSKYGQLPGPNGGITLNGDDLIAQANEAQTELYRQLNDYEVGNGGVTFGNTSFLFA